MNLPGCRPIPTERLRRQPGNRKLPVRADVSTTPRGRGSTTPSPEEHDMSPYNEAHRQARQMKAFGASRAELEDRARRFDNAGQYSAAAAFRAVASE